jgi:hypothetical protein
MHLRLAMVPGPGPLGVLQAQPVLHLARPTCWTSAMNDRGVKMGSEDAGERWYQLIQADGDLTMITRSLRARADRLRTDARARKWSGPQRAKVRQMLRDEADQCIVIARRGEEITFRG